MMKFNEAVYLSRQIRYLKEIHTTFDESNHLRIHDRRCSPYTVRFRNVLKMILSDWNPWIVSDFRLSQELDFHESLDIVPSFSIEWCWIWIIYNKTYDKKKRWFNRKRVCISNKLMSKQNNVFSRSEFVYRGLKSMNFERFSFISGIRFPWIVGHRSWIFKGWYRIWRETL